MYKHENDINPTFVGNLFTSHDPHILYEKFEQAIVNTKPFGLNVFQYEGAKIWNELLTHIKGTYDLNDFIGKIRKWSGPSCVLHHFHLVVYFHFCHTFYVEPVTQ